MAQVDLPQLRYNVPDTYQDLFFLRPKSLTNQSLPSVSKITSQQRKELHQFLDDAV